MVKNKIKLLIAVLLVLLTITACDKGVEPETPVPQTKMLEWETYENNRFNYKIKYPSHWDIRQSENNDGIQFMVDEAQDIRVYASHLMDESDDPLKNAKDYDIDPEVIQLNAGLEAKLIKGAMNGQQLYELVVVIEDKDYHFVAKTTSEFYNNNQNILEQMAYSFELSQAFSAKRALSIEKLFYQLVFKPELQDGSYVVANFETKEELINAASKYAKRSLVQDCVNDYYTMENNHLKVIPTEAPATISESVDYQFNKQDDGSYTLVQKNMNQLFGRYQVTITFEKIDGVWKIVNRTFTMLEEES